LPLCTPDRGPKTVRSNAAMPRAPSATVGRPVEWIGPSRMTIRSARACRGTSDRRHEVRRAGFFLAVEDDAQIRGRREVPEAFSASSAASSATIGDLSSDADRA
jgi:hypothetical protein